jgi:outer membrane protein assembly factor BamB
MSSALFFIFAIVPVAAEPAPVGFIESIDPKASHESLSALLAEAGAPGAKDLTAAAKAGKESFDGLRAVIVGSFATREAGARTFLNERGAKLRAFVEGGGLVLVLAQRAAQLPEDDWVPPRVTVTRCAREHGSLKLLLPDHPLLAAPHRLDAAALDAGWRGPALSTGTLDVAGGGAAIAAQDDSGRDPWLYEAGWGKGRAVFSAWPLEAFDPKEPGARALAVRFLANFLAYGAAVRDGKAPAIVAKPPREMTGVVFRDNDGDGERGPAEPGIAGVAASDGLEVTVTDAEGRFRLAVLPELRAMVFVSVPAGYRKTHRFYRDMPEGDGPVEFRFGLRPMPAGAYETHFAQVADLHVGYGKPPNGVWNLLPALEEVAEHRAALRDEPRFVVATGDLTNTAIPEQFAELRRAIEASPIPFLSVVGNHDVGGGRGRFREYLGPDYYSLDAGRYHVVVLNTVQRPRRQEEWLAKDLALLPEWKKTIVAVHYPPTRPEMEEYGKRRVQCVLSGHWHSTKVSSEDGVMSVNTPAFIMGGIDLSPAGFRTICVSELDLYFHEIGAPRISRIVQPGGGVLPGPGNEIVVSLHSSSDAIAGATYRLLSEGREIAAGDLKADDGGAFLAGDWSWSARSPVPIPLSGELEVTARTRKGKDWVQVTRWNQEDIASEAPVVPAVKLGRDWPCFMGSPGRRGEATPLRPPFRLAWHRNLSGRILFASPVVAGGRVYAVSIEPKQPNTELAGLDAVTGKKVWGGILESLRSPLWHSPAAASGKVFVVRQRGDVLAFDGEKNGLGRLTELVEPDDKDTRWFKSAPAVLDGILYAGNNARTAAIRIDDGKVLWQKKYADDWICGWGSPAVSGKRVVAPGLWSRPPVGVDAATGEVLWEAKGKDAKGFTIQGSPCIDGDLVFFGRVDAKVSAHSLEKGTLVWESPAGENWVPSTPAVSRGRVVVGCGDGAVRAYTRDDGKLLWERATGPSLLRFISYRSDPVGITSSPTISGGLVYIGGGDGILRALDLEKGTEVWSHDFGAPVLAAPAISGNALFVATFDGGVYALVGRE